MGPSDQCFWHASFLEVVGEALVVDVELNLLELI